jgi:hypothetical protein
VRFPLEKLTVTQLVKKFPAFYGTRSFITVLTAAGRWFLSWASCSQSKLVHPTSIRSILMLSSHPQTHFSSGLFPAGFAPKFCTHFSSLPSMRHTPPTSSFFSCFGEDYIQVSSYKTLLQSGIQTPAAHCLVIWLTQLLLETSITHVSSDYIMRQWTWPWHSISRYRSPNGPKEKTDYQAFIMITLLPMMDISSVW